jgi:hypothetical protein
MLKILQLVRLLQLWLQQVKRTQKPLWMLLAQYKMSGLLPLLVSAPTFCAALST